MSSLSPKDRVSLCSFTFSDGRRCRTPRVAKHPRFCFYHAQKEARARTARKLGKDLAYFFSGKYLSACDLSTALARLIPAVVCGDVKPKTAHTVAYLAQTLMRSIHISEQEYINAFGTDGWRKSVRNSVKSNYDYRFPPDPASQVVAGLQTGRGRRVVAGLQTGEGQAPQPDPAPHTTLPPTSAEFVHPVVAGLQTGGAQAPQPDPALPTADETDPLPATQFVPSVAPAVPHKPPRTSPSPPEPAPSRDAHALHLDHGCRLLIDGKPF
jgi:hypothetical protein